MKSVVPHEVQKFSSFALSRQWWSSNGALRSLHMMNPVRVQFMQQAIGPLHGRTILDVGCGAGILSESLARLGANVTGVDASSDAIGVAAARAKQVHNAHLPLSYTHGVVADVQSLHDVVVASEVIEHVDRPLEFLQHCCARVTSDEGYLVVSTLSKRILTLISHVWLPEHILGVLPEGTHDWARFIPEADLERVLRSEGFERVQLRYIAASPNIAATLATGTLQLSFELTDQNTGHYIFCGRRRTPQ